jgi:hypothetical protein
MQYLMKETFEISFSQSLRGVKPRRGKRQSNPFNLNRKRDCFSRLRRDRNDKTQFIFQICLLLLLCINPSFAQQARSVYEIPFPEGKGASKENTIELSIENISALTAEKVKIEATSIPDWITFTEKTVVLSSLKSKEEQTAAFTFSVEKTAKVNKEETISFTITDKNGQRWTKDIKVTVAPPNTYELLQNYPNPFNPTTTIEYQLPGTGLRFNVSLKIYDAIGREVANLVNEQQEPGYYQKTFDASRYASGMYIYRLIAKDDQDKRHLFQKKMVLVK